MENYFKIGRKRGQVLVEHSSEGLKDAPYLPLTVYDMIL